MKTNEIRLLLEQLLSITQDLQIKVLRDSDNIDGWTCLIYKREEIIEQISSLQQQGETISDENKMDYLKKVYEIDQQLFPLIEQKYDDLDRQSKNIQKSQYVGAKYGSYGNINPYGAYFDKRN